MKASPHSPDDSPPREDYQYSLRALLIFMVLVPPALAGAWWLFQSEYGGSFLLWAIVVVIATIAAWISFGPERRFRRELAGRQPLNKGEFVRQFYTDTAVPADIPLRLRPIYCRYFDIEITKLRPADRPPEISELDTVDLVRQIETEFGVTIPDKDAEELDGSFDSIVRYLAECRGLVGPLATEPADPKLR